MPTNDPHAYDDFATHIHSDENIPAEWEETEPMSDNDTTYNGWANFATWNVNLWIQNDEGLYGHALDLMRAWRDDAYGELEGFDGACAREIARELFPTGKTPDDVEISDPHIAWSEIADALLELIGEND